MSCTGSFWAGSPSKPMSWPPCLSPMGPTWPAQRGLPPARFCRRHPAQSTGTTLRRRLTAATETSRWVGSGQARAAPTSGSSWIWGRSRPSARSITTRDTTPPMPRPPGRRLSRSLAPSTERTGLFWWKEAVCSRVRWICLSLRSIRPRSGTSRSTTSALTTPMMPSGITPMSASWRSMRPSSQRRWWWQVTSWQRAPMP